MAEASFIAGTIPFALLGSTHLALTLRDLLRPTYLKPTDDTLVPALEATGVALMAPAPGAQTMWRAWLGANPTHGLGLLVFALLLFAVAVHDAALASDIPGLRPMSIAVALAMCSSRCASGSCQRRPPPASGSPASSSPRSGSAFISSPIALGG